MQGRSSQRDRDSTIDHLRDLAELLDDDALRTLADELTALAATGSAPGTDAEATSAGPAATEQPERSKPSGTTVPAPTVPATTPAAVPAAGELTIDMLPAGHGDCLVVTYGDPVRRILIDGGPAPKYRNGLARYLERSTAADRHFDLFVVTHVDSDHIDGAVILLQDLARLGVDFDDVWFNGWRQLSNDRGALQGEFLGALLTGKPWNQRFAGEAVAVPDAGALPVIDLPGGARLTIVSPEPSGLDRLEREWTAAVAEAGFVPGDEAASLALLKKRKALQPKARGEALYGGDNSVANASSIAFVLEYGGRSCLLTGDGYADVLTRGLDRLRRERGVDRLPIDVVKLPHHGSAYNVRPELFRTVDCTRFLVSTNGDYFKHPDPETLQLLAREVGECEVVFNHDNEVVRRWETVLEPELRERLTAVYPSAGEAPRIKV
jgi:beta-lactamase superfamily II metal-dependent hydrolase